MSQKKTKLQADIKYERKPQLEFTTVLSFAQELRLEESPLEQSNFYPASDTIEDPDVSGIAKLSFSQDFQTLDIDVDIRGDLSDDYKVTLAHIHLEDASKTGPLTVSLYPNDKACVKITNERFVLKIQLTNDDIIPRKNDNNFRTNTIASLYNAIRGNNLYIDAHGSGDYVLGMIRGQIYLN